MKLARSSRLVHRAVVDAVGLGREPRALQALDAEALHDPDAGDALLDDARQLGQLLLQLRGRPGTCGG